MAIVLHSRGRHGRVRRMRAGGLAIVRCGVQRMGCGALVLIVVAACGASSARQPAAPKPALRTPATFARTATPRSEISPRGEPAHHAEVATALTPDVVLATIKGRY